MEPIDPLVERILKDALGNNTNTAKIEINAGGLGVWIATTCCAVMVAVSLLLALWVVDLSRKVSDLGDYLQAIYVQAPHLKPKESE